MARRRPRRRPFPSLNGDLPRLDSAPQHGAPVASIALPDGRPGRCTTHRFPVRRDDESPPSAPIATLTLSLARDDLDVRAALAKLRAALAGVGLAAIIASAAVLAWRVRVGLKPAEQLAAAIGAIDEKNLAARLPPQTAPKELQPIAERLNDLLARLHAAFEREKSMTADVAHELRTPLAGLRTTLDVALSRQREADQYRTALSDCRSITERTQSLVENLLTLARLDANDQSLRREPTDLDRLLRDAWRPFNPAANSRNLKVIWEIQSGLNAATDPDKLRLVFGNLFANAVAYANTGGTITITARTVDAKPTITVANTGADLPPHLVPRVFDRFWRGDPARRADNSRYGLGLPLCKTILARLNGQIHAQINEPQVFTITLTL